MKGPTRMPGEPRSDLGVLVDGVVVGDGVDQFAGWHGCLDGVEEADELLMAVLLHAAADHAAIQHIESGKPRGGAMSLVVVLHGPTAGPSSLAGWLRAIERLDLGAGTIADHCLGRSPEELETGGTERIHFPNLTLRDSTLAYNNNFAPHVADQTLTLLWRPMSLPSVPDEEAV